MDLSKEGDMFDERGDAVVGGSRRVHGVSPELAAVLVAVAILLALAL